MEPLDPFSQLASCCFGRRSRNHAPGFKTAALRNQYYYSPSMAHMNAAAAAAAAAASGGNVWPMTSSGIPPTTIFTGGPSFQAQPYILLTQPVIVNAAGQLEPQQQLALIQQQQQQQQPQQQLQVASLQEAQQQLQAIQYLSQSPLHKVPSMMPGQFAIYSTGEPARNVYAPAATATAIYETPARQHMGPNMVRNLSVYLNRQQQQQQPLIQHQQQQQQQQRQGNLAGQQPRRRQLNADIFKRLELIEKQVDLSAEMDLVERHGIVTTRYIEPITLAPHLNDDMLRRYQTNFLLDEDEAGEHVIKFIEIIKRPGQTLGLYIRAVQFEAPRLQTVREGIVITKIESDSPVYSSKALHIGDEILSINLIDIQGMSLDDVVTLMSIPKRLVLVLRVPRERETGLLALGCDPIKQLQQQQHQRQVQAGQLGPQPPSDRRQIMASGQYSPPDAHRMAAERPVGQSISQASFVSSPNHNQQQINIGGQHQQQQQQLQSEFGTHLARPARAHSAAIHETLQEEGQTFGDSPVREVGGDFSSMPAGRPRKLTESEAAGQSAFMADKSRRTTGEARQFLGTSGPMLIEESSHAMAQMPQLGRFEPRPRSPVISQIDRQIAISQSIEESNQPNEATDQFRNYSMDPEIATLEREAMNKVKHPSAQARYLANGDDQLVQPQGSRYSFEQASQRLDGKAAPASSTLPRRTLPTRPDLLSPQAGLLSPSSPIKPAVISNIRLGDTPEQSNYFTSSIDAINRELKELRRQRLAMTSPSNDQDDLNRGPKGPQGESALNLNLNKR